MKRNEGNILTGLLIFFCVTLIGLYAIFTLQHTTQRNTDITSQNTIEDTRTREDIILETMSLEEKVGQLFIFGFWGYDIDQETLEFFQNTHIGGAILLGYNIEDDNQLKALNTRIQTLSTIPMFIAIDQEGGIVSRLSGDEEMTYPQKDIIDREQAYNIAKQRGEELKELGINMNFSPVLDNISNPDSFLYERVFDTDGDVGKLTSLGISMVQGYKDAGIVSVPKHFPGHSNDSVDSHDELPVVDIVSEGWDQYIFQFTEVIANAQPDAIMIGHILIPSIDDQPASISEEIITNRLRNDLGFNGVVITDDMEMKALTNLSDTATLARQSLIAGSDILLYVGDISTQLEAYDTILNAVNDGTISEEMLNEKVLRILHLKVQLFNL